MKTRPISIEISKQILILGPDRPLACFEVSVCNDSDKFVGFELELLAAGAGPRRSSDWYRCIPRISAAKPPGNRTFFQVEIFASPIPDYVGQINITVQVYSPQLRTKERRIVRLSVGASEYSERFLFDLPIRRFQSYPERKLDIPVWIQNLSRHPIDVLLYCRGLNSTWAIASDCRRIRLESKSRETIAFQYQLPAATVAHSKAYPFTILASIDGEPARESRGVLEILPQGLVRFSVESHCHAIPPSRGWLPNWWTRAVTFNTRFDNDSNLSQQANVTVRGKHRDMWSSTFPTRENSQLEPGKPLRLPLTIEVRRPWLGFRKLLHLQATPTLSDRRLGSTDPATQPIELWVYPILPLWIAIALLCLTIALFPKFPIQHVGPVETVLFSGNGRLVLSGSKDCTVRQWRLEGSSLKPEGRAPSGSPDETCNDKPLRPVGVLRATNEGEIESLALLPGDNNVVAVGFESGKIQLLDAQAQTLRKTLIDPDATENDRDEVFDLVFTKNSRILYSAHADGALRIWEGLDDRSPAEIAPKGLLKVPEDKYYSIQAMTLMDDRHPIAAGQFKQIVLWDLTASQPCWFTLRAAPDTSPSIDLSGLEGGEGDYIWAVDFLPEYSLLATSDSQGYITLWDLESCRSSIDARVGQNELDCAVRDRWLAAESAVRGIKFDSDGRFIGSVDDSSRVKIWPLTAEQKRDKARDPEELSTRISEAKQRFTKSEKLLKTIDIIAVDGKNSAIVTGGSDGRVSLYRYSFSTDAQSARSPAATEIALAFSR